jgi:hypothetical protein
MERVYITQLDSSGIPIMLFRFYGDEKESWEEYLEGNNWIQDNSLLDILRDLHNPQFKEVNSDEASIIAKNLGGSI